jgi:hypothetical protein
MTTSDEGCTRRIKSMIVMAKAAFYKKNTLFICKSDLKVKEESSKMLHLEHNFVWCSKLETSESSSEIPGHL